MNFKAISDTIYANTADRIRMQKMNEVYYAMADYIKENDPDAYKKFTKEAEGVYYYIEDTEAEEIVRSMKPSGEHWTRSQVDEFVRSKGQEPSTEWYLVMNMAYNDYRPTAEKFNVDDTEFYYSIASDFINDQDACDHKVEKYFS